MVHRDRNQWTTDNRRATDRDLTREKDQLAETECPEKAVTEAEKGEGDRLRGGGITQHFTREGRVNNNSGPEDLA